jgi:hypothetical protein
MSAELLKAAANYLENYAEFLRTECPVDLNRHPYVPEMEQAVEELRALSTQTESPSQPLVEVQEPVAWIKDGELVLHRGLFLDEKGWDRLIYAPPPTLFKAFEEPETQAETAILFEHEDGRYAVNPDTTGDPKWHRLGPVALPSCVGEVGATWQPINSMNLTDELVWLRKGEAIDGPRIAETDDYDRYAFWAPCEPPSSRQDPTRLERRLEICHHERMRAEFRADLHFKTLMGIFNLLNPEATDLGDGRVMKFANPYANETLDRLSARIRSIKSDVEAAHGISSSAPGGDGEIK